MFPCMGTDFVMMPGTGLEVGVELLEVEVGTVVAIGDAEQDLRDERSPRSVMRLTKYTGLCKNKA